MTGYKTIYLDTAPIIYFLQRSDLYFDVISNFFQDAFDRNAALKTSAITVEEFLVYPYQTGLPKLKQNFYLWLEKAEIEIVPITPEIADVAAAIRGKFKAFKGMDALQLAAFKSSGCDIFLTNDKQLL